MPFSFEATKISGLMFIRPHMVSDERGFYRKYYEKNVFQQNGISDQFTESSDILSKKGTLRGLHYQSEHSQAKLLHVISGSIYDVAVDLRKNSPTYGQWASFYLRAEDPKLIFIPPHFAHGFLVLEDNTLFSYQCSGKYVPEACGGIVWNDPDLAIPWPLDQVESLILSEKDQQNQSFKIYYSRKG